MPDGAGAGASSPPHSPAPATDDALQDQWQQAALHHGPEEHLLDLLDSKERTRDESPPHLPFVTDFYPTKQPIQGKRTPIDKYTVSLVGG